MSSASLKSLVCRKSLSNRVCKSGLGDCVLPLLFIKVHRPIGSNAWAPNNNVLSRKWCQGSGSALEEVHWPIGICSMFDDFYNLTDGNLLFPWLKTWCWEGYGALWPLLAKKKKMNLHGLMWPLSCGRRV